MDHIISNNIPQAPLRPKGLTKATTRLLYSLLPSLLLNTFKHDASGRQDVTSETAWLDGLRGLSAIAVLNFHYIFAFNDLPHVGFNADVKHRSLLRLPFVRLSYDGFSNVCVFFIASGYVCSLGALRRMHNHQHEKLFDSLSRSVFRRGLRLYLPTMCMALITAVCAYLGAFDRFRTMMVHQKVLFPGYFSEQALEKYPTLTGQLSFWCNEMFQLMNIWNVAPQYLHHDPHLWTIGYEYRSSMYLYVTLLGMSSCKPSVRLVLLCAAGILNLFWRRWEGALFFGGAVIAYITIIRSSKAGTPLSPAVNEKTQPTNRSRPDVLRLLGYIFALWIMSYPLNNFTTPSPGFEWMNHCIPTWYKRKDKFPKTWGTLLFILLLATSNNKIGRNASPLHRIFNSRFAQYMGQIMFGFYLVHGTVLHAIGYTTPHLVWYYTGQSTSFTYAAGLSIGWVVSFLTSLWAADLFTRVIDGRCAGITRWIESCCFEKP